MIANKKTKKFSTKRILALITAICVLVGFMFPILSDTIFDSGNIIYANALASALEVEESGSYNLFNSGLTSSAGVYYSSSQGSDDNPDSHSYSNNGYDIYGRIKSYSTVTVGMGLSFTISSEITERAILSVKAYDVDEEDGELDTVTLVDETSGEERISVSLPE